MIRHISFALALLLLHSVSAEAEDEQARLIGECDRLAASDLDPDRPASVSGVPLALVDTNAALHACEAAVQAAPDDRRIIYELGRTYDLVKEYDKARRYYERADALGSLAATNNLGALYKYGRGVAIDPNKARQFF